MAVWSGSKPVASSNGGSVVFWTQIPDGGEFEVKLENGESGFITDYKTSDTAPICGENGYPTFELATGSYKFKAELSNIDFDGNSMKWEGQVEILPGQCYTFEFLK